MEFGFPTAPLVLPNGLIRDSERETGIGRDGESEGTGATETSGVSEGWATPLD